MRRRVEWGRSGVAFALIDELWVLPKRISDCEHTAIVLACQVHKLFVILVQLFLKQVRVTINKLFDQTLRFIIACAASDGECEMLLLALILPRAARARTRARITLLDGDVALSLCSSSFGELMARCVASASIRGARCQLRCSLLLLAASCRYRCCCPRVAGVRSCVVLLASLLFLSRFLADRFGRCPCRRRPQLGDGLSLSVIGVKATFRCFRYRPWHRLIVHRSSSIIHRIHGIIVARCHDRAICLRVSLSHLAYHHRLLISSCLKVSLSHVRFIFSS